VGLLPVVTYSVRPSMRLDTGDNQTNRENGVLSELSNVLLPSQARASNKELESVNMSGHAKLICNDSNMSYRNNEPKSLYARQV
jgi:hypothetical protein